MHRAVLITVVLLTAAVAGADEPFYRFTTNLVVTTPQATRQLPATFVVHHYTPVSEAQQLRGVLEQGGQGALVSAIAGHGDGHIELGGFRQPIALAVAKATDDGFTYFFITPRRIRYEEREENGASLDFPFGIAFFDVGSRGLGEGTLHLAATLVITEDGWVEILDYEGGEGRMEDVKGVR